MDIYVLNMAYLLESKGDTQKRMRQAWRRHLKQSLKHPAYVPEPPSPWEVKLRKICRDNRIPRKDFNILKQLLNKLDTSGKLNLDSVSYAKLEEVVLHYYKSELEYKQYPHRDVRASSVYSLQGKPQKWLIGPDTELRRQALAVYRHPASSSDEQKARDLVQNAAAARVYAALSQEEDPHIKVGDNEYYYLFVRPSRNKERTPKSTKGTNTYEVTIPVDLDLRNKTSFPRHREDLVNFEKVKDTRPYWKGAKNTLMHVEGMPFKEAVKHTQEYAWNNGAEKIAKALESWRKITKAISYLEDKLNKTDREKEQLKYLKEKGMPALANLFTFRTENMGKAWTWYLWLVASENAYGIHVSERKGTRPRVPASVDEPEGKSIKGSKISDSPIRPITEKPEHKYAGELFRGVGYDQHNLYNLVEKPEILKRGGVEKIWFPVVGSVKKFGIDVNNITRYMHESRRQKRMQRVAHNIAGHVGNRLVVKRDQPFPIYPFSVKGVPYLFAVVPAKHYLLHFDSPIHPGKRLVHGKQELQPGRTILKQSTTSDKEPDFSEKESFEKLRAALADAVMANRARQSARPQPRPQEVQARKVLDSKKRLGRVTPTHKRVGRDISSHYRPHFQKLKVDKDLKDAKLELKMARHDVRDFLVNATGRTTGGVQRKKITSSAKKQQDLLRARRRLQLARENYKKAQQRYDDFYKA